ncbi:MAG: hypothetical protein NDJ18_07480 [candidate division Zixibacteria bacterium]|nr:hypothetical protein [candidate division Zixibacteria bacterium]
MSKLISLIITGAFLVLAGCGDSPTDPTAANSSPISNELPTAALDLVRVYGAQDDGTMTIESADLAGRDLAALLADTSFDVYAVTLIWGSLHLADLPVPTTVTIDWSGGASVNGVGKMGVVQTLSFEPGQDSLVETNDPVSIAWHSVTTNDLDALICYVAMKRGIVYVVPPMFGVRTLPVSFEVPVETLTRFQAFYPVGNMAGMAIHARKLRPNICPEGTIEGEWVRSDSSDMQGRFSGKWLTADARHIGYVRGRFWVDNASNLFEGELTNLADSVIGHVKGRWSYMDPAMCPLCGTRFGIFAGEIIDLDRNPIGGLKGEFGRLDLTTSPRVLALRGHWRMNCLSRSEPGLAAD